MTKATITIVSKSKSTAGATARRAFFIVKDHLGSVRAVLGGDSSVQARFDYDPYGIVYADGPANASKYRYLYTGQEYEPELGIYNYRARMYDPLTAGFISPDPARQTFSPFTYCGGNPVGFTDPTGTVFPKRGGVRGRGSGRGRGPGRGRGQGAQPPPVPPGRGALTAAAAPLTAASGAPITRALPAPPPAGSHHSAASPHISGVITEFRDSWGHTVRLGYDIEQYGSFAPGFGSGRRAMAQPSPAPPAGHLADYSNPAPPPLLRPWSDEPVHIIFTQDMKEGAKRIRFYTTHDGPLYEVIETRSGEIVSFTIIPRGG